MDETEATSSLLSSIPELHYDLIARIMPGVLSIAAASLLWLSAVGASLPAWMLPHAVAEAKSGEEHAVSIGSGLLFLIGASTASWCFGMLLTPLGDWINKILFKVPVFRSFCKTFNADLQTAVEHKFLTKPRKGDQWDHKRERHEVLTQSEVTYQELHDSLKGISTTQSAILSKAQAELLFYQSSAAGLLLVLIVAAALRFASYRFQQAAAFSLFSFSLASALVILVWCLSLWGLWHKSRRVWSRHMSFLKLRILAEGTEEKKTQPTAKSNLKLNLQIDGALSQTGETGH